MTVITSQSLDHSADLSSSNKELLKAAAVMRIRTSAMSIVNISVIKFFCTVY